MSSYASRGTVIALMLIGVLACTVVLFSLTPQQAYAIAKQCSDGDDNDSNGLTDYPDDLGCTSSLDNTESGYVPSQPNLSASNWSPAWGSSQVAGSVSFSAGISNSGTGAASNFSNLFQIYNNATGGSSYVDAGTASLGAGASGSISASYTISTAGAYQYRGCADLQSWSWSGTVTESNEGDNCSAWTSFSITDPPLSGSCSANPSSAQTGDNIIWSATASGGTASGSGHWASGGSTYTKVCGAGINLQQPVCSNPYGPASGSCTIGTTCKAHAYAGPGDCYDSYGPIDQYSSVTTYSCVADSGDPYSYSWSGTDGLSGSTASVSKSYSSSGTKSGSVTITSGSQSTTVSCSTSVSPSYCTSTANACGQTNYGVCPQSPPANPTGYGNSCTSTANACGQTTSGTIQCNGSCSASAPANPAGYGNACTSSANSCGQTNAGTIQCNGTCSASAPSDATCTPSTPTGLSASCAAPGTLANFSWNPAWNASAYYIRITKNSACPAGWQTVPWDTSLCMPNPDWYTGTSVSSYATTPGATYNLWVYSANGAGYNTTPASTSFTCTGQANLTALNWSPAYGSILPSGTIAFTAGISNTGTAAATSFANSFNLYNTVTGSSILFAANTATVGAGGSSSMTGSYAPTPGSYYYRGCADIDTSWLGSISESDENDNCSAWTTLTVTDPGIVASCSVSPTTANVNQSVTWSSSASGGNGVYSYSWSGTESLSGSGSTASKTYSSSGTKTGSLTVTSGAQQTTVACSNSVNVLAPPSANLSSSPNPISVGDSSTLTWSSSGATSCTGTGFSTGGTTSGSVSTGVLSANASYQVTCTGTGGSTSDIETVVVTVPTVDIHASDDRVPDDSQTTISWSSSGATSCTVSGPGLSSTALSGSQSVTVTTQQRYILTCNGATDSAIVNVDFNQNEL